MRLMGPEIETLRALFRMLRRLVFTTRGREKRRIERSIAAAHAHSRRSGHSTFMLPKCQGWRCADCPEPRKPNGEPPSMDWDGAQ